MKTAFIRGLWGNIWEDTAETTIRRGKVCRDIERVVKSEFKMDFTTYVFGEENAKSIESIYGIKAVCINKSPILWDMKTELYRHKLEIIYQAMKDYDKIVYLDWDCILIKPLLADCWDILSKGASCQANLFQYRTKKCLWRTIDWRKTCNGGFIYISDKNAPYYFIENWNELRAWAKRIQSGRQENGKDLRFREKCLMFDDEPAISYHIDNLCGGWPGIERYWKDFEPKVCNLRRKSAFTEEQNNSKDACFMHML